MPRGRHRHSPPLHRILPPLAVAGASALCAAGAWLFAEPVVLRVLVAAAAAAAVTGAVLMRSWDRAAGRRVAELTRARAGDEWKTEERIADIEADLDESRALRAKLDEKLRTKRVELAALRGEHAALLRRYATAETERAGVLESRRLLAMAAAAPAKALPAASSTPTPSAYLRASMALDHLTRNAAEQESRNSRDMRDAQGPRDGRGPQVGREVRDGRGPRNGRGPQNVRDRQGSEDVRDGQDARSPQDAPGSQGPDRSRDARKAPDVRGPQGSRGPQGPRGPRDAWKAPSARGAQGAAGSRGPRDAPQSPDARKAEEPEGKHKAAAGSAVPSPEHSRPSSAIVPRPDAASAVVPYASLRRPSSRLEGGFDFFGTQKPVVAAIEAVRNVDLADVVGEEALEAARKVAGTSRAVGQVIDLTAHDETEQLDVAELRSAIS
ncbi:hypothetical protein [Streptomyces sp. H27-C3]|uniref:hypothetical protein n=1 Tax=Streptomyces sp. H27-C3 TaxID=3046305 RepID=UPI0024BAA673|nr:hypothetical protein [Streptomyces sp. H27-C3]MDJ0461676.1 hypothetical protein [Streptomyces sp. H27-C3]